jgi:hypothetical protein
LLAYGDQAKHLEGILLGLDYHSIFGVLDGTAPFANAYAPTAGCWAVGGDAGKNCDWVLGENSGYLAYLLVVN